MPGFDQCHSVGTGLVPFKNLRDPRPKHGHLREAPLANVRGYFQKPFGGKNIMEESAQIGEGGAKRFDTLLAEDLQLTAALAPLKFRRKTRQERW